MFKYIIIRILGLVLIFLGSNYLYTLLLFERDLNEKSDKILELRESQKSADILYFAESSNVNFHENDSVKFTLSEFTNLFYPELNIVAVNNVAAHSGIFKKWLNDVDVQTKNLKALVVTMNLRSFDAAWRHSKLETPLQESFVLLQPYPNIINRFLLSLQAFDSKTEKEREIEMLKEWRKTELKFPFAFKYKTVTDWDWAMANGGQLNADGSWNTKKSELACHYIKAYAFNLDENNQRVKDFDEIANWAEKNKVKVYFNLLAENVEYADSLVGKELVFLMKQNRDFLVKRYTTSFTTVVDNLELVNGKDFTDQDWTTEHYGYRGRMVIARNLAHQLKRQFEINYKKAY
jgi:hypothetical protein